MQGANTLTIGFPDLEEVKSPDEVNLTNEPIEATKGRQRKGKGKIIESHTKVGKKTYGSVTPKGTGRGIGLKVKHRKFLGVSKQQT